MKTIKLMIASMFLVVATSSFGFNQGGDTAAYRLEMLEILPSAVGTDKCVQVGVFLDYTGADSHRCRSPLDDESTNSEEQYG